MEATAARKMLLHQEHGRIAIPGDEGVIQRLTFLGKSVFAFVSVTFSTGQPGGHVVVEVKPERRVRSFTIAPG